MYTLLQINNGVVVSKFEES